FVADPFNLAIRQKLSHPTGAAVDLGLYNLESKKLVDMGTAFDDPTPQSATMYFKDHLTAPEANFHQVRMMLFNIMIDAGFINYSKEWWHYDLGDYSWANKKGSSWYYSIIESLT